MLYTSLNEIKSFTPCASGWKAILTGQNKRGADDRRFPLVDALESNSISDVCWLIGKRKKEIQICVKFAKMCADSVKHLSNKRTNVYAANAAYAAADAADDAANAAAYAADAADDAADAAAYAAYAADAADDAADAANARQKQQEINKQFFIQCIREYVA